MYCGRLLVLRSLRCGQRSHAPCQNIVRGSSSSMTAAALLGSSSSSSMECQRRPVGTQATPNGPSPSPPSGGGSAEGEERSHRHAIPVVSSADRKLVPHGAPSPSTEAPIPTSAQAAVHSPPVDPSSSQASATTMNPPAYNDWEMKAIILPLIPARGTIETSALVGLLPPPAAQILRDFRGGPGAYIRQKLTQEVMTLYGNQLTRTESSPSALGGYRHPGSTRGATQPPREAPKAAKTNLEPPPFSSVASTPADPSSRKGGRLSASSLRNPTEIMDMLVEYIPTYYINLTTISEQLPPDITRHLTGTTLFFFIKRFKQNVDVRTQHGNTEVRLRPDFNHAKRGSADAKYATGANTADMQRNMAVFRRPPRNSEANLIMFLLPKIPEKYTSLADVLQEVTGMVSRHPSFDPRLGIMGLLEKYPEYFQVVDGKIRIRPYRSAPNSIDDLDAESSPLPGVFAKIRGAVDAALADPALKNCEAEKLGEKAAQSTGRLFALLTNEEKRAVKSACRSFPRFLRMHGKEIVVSVDNLKVKKFMPEYERCADTVARHSLSSSSISPDDPILRIPAEMDEATNADWAVKELYDALPLMQCAELEDVLSLVPNAVRDALPQGDQLLECLDRYPEYFMHWKYPDDTNTIVIQRAKLELCSSMEREDIIRAVLPVIPQGGIDADRLLRRVPLSLQRYFYHHGLKKVLQGIPDYFVVAGDRIIRIG